MKIAPAATSHLLLLSLSPMVLIRPDAIVDAAPMSDNVIASYFEPYPDCNVDTSNIPWFMRHPGDGACAYELNIPECGFDGGDCDEFNEKWPDCKPIVGAPVDGRPKFNFGQPGSYWYTHNTKVELWYQMLNNSICDPFLNTEGCGYDGGDCIEFNEKYPGCKAAATSWVGNGYCDNTPLWWDSSYNTEECGFDGGDCVEVATDEEDTVEPTPTIEPTEESTSDGTGVASDEASEPWDEEMRAKYPNCTAIDASKIGNGRCDGAYMTEECGWDGGDCLVFHELFPDCVPDKTSAHWMLLEDDLGLNVHLFWPEVLKDGECDGFVNTPECGFDDGDCIEYNEKYPDCQSPMPLWVGNGFCACLPENNDGEYSEECGWDGGDCEGAEEVCEGSGGTASKNFQGLVWIVLALAYAIGV